MEVLQIDGKTVYLGKRNPLENKGLCRITHPAMLAGEETLGWLDENFLKKQKDTMEVSFVKEIEKALTEGEVYFANLAYGSKEEWTQRLKAEKKGKRRLHLLALGDVGSTVLTALKLMGGDCLETIGIYDVNPAVCDRWERELNQAAFPWDYDRLPQVEIVTEENLFACDMFVFCASKGIPPVGQEQVDVRMVQYEANRSIVSMFARKARAAGFQGIFAVVSDPVDPLCKAAFLASNEGENGQMDGKGLRPEQIQGYGLGVMNARAAYYAKKDPRFTSFLKEGRAFGPHGEDLVIANSIVNYDDALSRELTKMTVEANLRMRELGFKPYVAPAISSAAISLLLTLRGEWHYSSNFLAGVYMGCKNKTGYTAEMEYLPLPEALFARIQKAYDGLEAIQ